MIRIVAPLRQSTDMLAAGIDAYDPEGWGLAEE
jgi:hypothetical protein